MVGGAHADARRASAGTADITSGFGRLDIAACRNCGHLSNRAFDTDAADELYGALVLTNEPVSPGMIAAVDETAALIMRQLEARARRARSRRRRRGAVAGAGPPVGARRSRRTQPRASARALRRHRRNAAPRDVPGPGAGWSPLRRGGVPPGHRACARTRAVPGRASREPCRRRHRLSRAAER